MSLEQNPPVAARHVFNTSHIGRDTRHGYTSFVSILPAYFAGKYWCFDLSSDKVREPCRIDPHNESTSFFNAPPAVSTETWEDIFNRLQRFVSVLLEPQWYDVESVETRESSIEYLPPMGNLRESFKHSLVDLEPSREEIINLTMAKLAEVYPKKVDEVSAIYVSRYLDDITVTVLLQDTKYSRSLMDKLFEIEYTLHKQNPSLVMEFLYIPRLNEHRAAVIHPKANLIYDRETSVILSGSSVSSTT